MPGKKKFRRFEYKLIPFHGGSCLHSEQTILALNKLGLQGWQLIGKPSEANALNAFWWNGLFIREKL